MKTTDAYITEQLSMKIVDLSFPIYSEVALNRISGLNGSLESAFETILWD